VPIAGQGEVVVRRQGRRVILEPTDDVVGQVSLVSRRMARQDSASKQRASEICVILRLMLQYMLDTDTVSFASAPRRCGNAVLEHRPSELCISSITLAELRYGAERHRSRRLHRLISTFCDAIAIMPFDRQSAADRFCHGRRRVGAAGPAIGTSIPCWPLTRCRYG